MMKRSAALVSWLLLLGGTGCIQGPGGKMEAANAFSFESGRTPYAAAICIARNAKTLPNVTAEERLLGEASWEVVVRGSGWAAGTLATAETHNTGSGSLVSVRVTDRQRGDHEDFARQLLADCQARMVAR
jgi:hypothetical protein